MIVRIVRMWFFGMLSATALIMTYHSGLRNQFILDIEKHLIPLKSEIEKLTYHINELEKNLSQVESTANNAKEEAENANWR